MKSGEVEGCWLYLSLRSDTKYLLTRLRSLVSSPSSLCTLCPRYILFLYLLYNALINCYFKPKDKALFRYLPAYNLRTGILNQVCSGFMNQLTILLVYPIIKISFFRNIVILIVIFAYIQRLLMKLTTLLKPTVDINLA